MNEQHKLYTGETLKQNENGVWIICNSNNPSGYPIDLIDVIKFYDNVVKNLIKEGAVGLED